MTVLLSLKYLTTYLKSKRHWLQDYNYKQGHNQVGDSIGNGTHKYLVELKSPL